MPLDRNGEPSPVFFLQVNEFPAPLWCWRDAQSDSFCLQMAVAIVQPLPPNKDTPSRKESPCCCCPALIPCQALLQGAASQGKHTTGKVLLTAHFWFFLRQPGLCLTLPGQRAVTVPSSLCSPPMERGSLSDSGLGLLWASLAGSQIASCEEEFPVSSFLFNTPLCAEVFSERGFAIHCFCSVPFPGVPGFCSPAWAPPRLVWLRTDTHPSKCHHPPPVCARGEVEVPLSHPATYPHCLQ